MTRIGADCHRRVAALHGLWRAPPGSRLFGGGPATPRTNYLLIKCLEVIGVRLGGATEAQPEIGRENMRVLCDLAAQGKLKPRISHRLPLDRAGEAIQAIIDRKVIGKAVLVG